MDIRSAIQWLVVILAVLMGFCVSASAGPTYVYSGHFNLRIPADPDSSKDWMYDAIIEITDHLTIYDIDVGITLRHTNVFDLHIFLQSPIGTNLGLNMYNLDEYFEGEDYIQTIFDDEAEIPVEEGEPPFTGRFRPRAGNLLGIFDGQDAYGPWRLQIYDAYYSDTGNLKAFELTITVPAPPATGLLIVGVGLVALLRPGTRW